MQKVYLFPYAGCHVPLVTNKAIDYKQLDYLGHGRKLGKKKAGYLAEIVKDCFEEIFSEELNNEPFCFIGYSMGCLIAYEVIKQIKLQNKSMPTHLYLISSNPPNEQNSVDVSKMNPVEFLQYISTIQPISKELYDNQELLSHFLEITKHDFVLISEYKKQQLSIDKIACDGTIIYGKEDLTVDSTKIKEWHQFFNGKWNVISLENEGHFLSAGKLEEIVRLAANKKIINE